MSKKSKDLDEIFADTWGRRSVNLNGISYKDYLLSDHWKGIKLKASKRPNYKKCEFCDCQKVELHHTSYKWLWHKSELNVIIALCRKHHQEVHDLAKTTGLSVRLATTKLRRIYKPNFLQKNRINT